ncbi:MAG TPA: MarR family winged helix-turn-helix transcriptional regulator [Umezawaea sp.]|nr:MarR family winged helix-turn-helix transcriptional regulator [Umezawaea sp.]
MDAEDVGLHYLELAHRVRRLVDDRMVEGGLSLSRTKTLRVLAERGPLRQAALAAGSGTAARSVTQAVEALERDGLVERSPDPDDGRAKVVALTEAGTKALASGVEAGNDALRQVFGVLGEEGLAALAELLDVLDAGPRTPPPAGP